MTLRGKGIPLKVAELSLIEVTIGCTLYQQRHLQSKRQVPLHPSGHLSAFLYQGKKQQKYALLRLNESGKAYFHY